MANLVEQIITQTKAIVLAELGSTYQELQFIYDVEKNNLRGGKLAYGVRPLAASSTDGVMRFYTMDHGFEIILTDTIARGNDDSQFTTAITTMYNKADEIFKDLVNTKLSIANIVLQVNSPSLSEPEFFQDNKMVVLRMSYNVKYRSDLNL